MSNRKCNRCIFLERKRRLEKKGHIVKLIDSKKRKGMKAIEVDGNEMNGLYFGAVGDKCAC